MQRHALALIVSVVAATVSAQTPPAPAAQQLEAVTVEATRISGLVNQGIISRDENQAIYYTVIDRLEIERTGATDINELFRDLPQVAVMQTDTTMIAGTNGFLTFGGNTPTSRVDLRGFGNAGTTILVNGRRMPIVRETQGGGPDFTRLPLSAIERVEVLSGAGGGIYGSYTQGGVINIILRKEFTGRELSLNYGASLHGGAGEKRLTYTEGRGFRRGRSQLTWTLDAVIRDNMPFSDRPLYRRYRDHVPVPTDLASFNAWQASGGLNAFPSRPGIIVGRNAANQITPLILPLSSTTAVFASIPAGASGTSLTPASFAATANRYQPTEAYAGFALFSPSRRVSLNATYNHQFIPDRLNGYIELGFDYNRTYTDSPATPQTLNLTATDPRNPFRNGVTPGFVGQPVTFYYLPTDLPGTHRASENGTARVVLGLNGKLAPFQRPWNWAFDVSADYNRRYSVGYLPMQMLSSLQSLGATRPLAAAYYTSLADHDAFPNTTAASFLTSSSYRKNSDYVLMSNGVLRLNGESVNLPAGPVRNSFVGEWSIQTYENSFKNWYDDAFLVSLGGTPSTSSTPGKTERQDRRIGAEVTMPVFGSRWSPFQLHNLELTYAISRVDLPYLAPFTSSVYGLRVAPVRDVAFRFSWQQGTIPFADSLVIGSERFTDIVGSTARDPRRGNSLVGNYTQVSGPNFYLEPAETRTVNFGLILQPRFVKGLNVTFDYAYTERVNGNAVPTVAELLLYEDQYPGRIVRDAPTPSDTTLGWLGQIQTVDIRRVNVGNLWSQTFDTSVRYSLPAREAGTFDFTIRTAQTREFKQRQRPGQPIVNNLDTMNLNGTTVPKLRGSGSVQWRRKVWSASLASRYTESFRDTLGVAVDNSLTFNLQASYEIPFAQPGTHTGVRRFLGGTQWTLGVNNIFDFDPPYVQNPGNQGFPSFYSLFDDPRGRYVYVRIKKTL